MGDVNETFWGNFSKRKNWHRKFLRGRFLKPVFFFGEAWKKKWAWKPFFGLLFDFSTGKNLFSRPCFSVFFTPVFFFHGQNLGFFHGQKISFTAKNTIFFTDSIFFSRTFFEPTSQHASRSPKPSSLKKKITNRGFCKTGPYNMHGAGGVVQWWDTKGARSILLRGKNGLAAAAKKTRAAYWAPLSQLPLFR